MNESHSNYHIALFYAGMVAHSRRHVHTIPDSAVQAQRCSAAKYMHDFHEDGDHAMCNIQNHTIPEVQLIQCKKLSIQNFKGTGVLFSLR
jgi:hypothetical protein